MYHITAPVKNPPILQSRIVLLLSVLSLHVKKTKILLYQCQHQISLSTRLQIQLINLILNIYQYHNFQTTPNHRQSIIPVTRCQVVFHNSLITLIYTTTNIIPPRISLTYH